MNTDDLHRLIEEQRKAEFDNSIQLSLGELITKTKVILDEIENKDAQVRYDFVSFFPLGYDSWRGSYNELALDYQEEGTALSIGKFYDLIKSAVGVELEGYKGGEYLMTENTPVWVANYGHSGTTAVVDIVNKRWEVVIMTAYNEY